MSPEENSIINPKLRLDISLIKKAIKPPAPVPAMPEIRPINETFNKSISSLQ
jgi:hypothetical protein